MSARQDPQLPLDVLVALKGSFEAVHAAVAAIVAAVCIVLAQPQRCEAMLTRSLCWLVLFIFEGGGWGSFEQRDR